MAKHGEAWRSYDANQLMIIGIQRLENQPIDAGEHRRDQALGGFPIPLLENPFPAMGSSKATPNTDIGEAHGLAVPSLKKDEKNAYESTKPRAFE